MSNKKFLEFLFPDQPFFEGATDGIQGAPICHIFMSAAVSLKATESSSLSILEVGSWTGSSTLTWCEALKTYCLESGKILCVDPWISYFSSEQREQGSQYKLMAAMANLDFTYDIFQHNINFISPNVKVDHMRGKSDDILPYLKDNQFDLMYIDGDHSYKNSLFDIQSAKRLVKVGGFICGDDLEVQGSECDLNFIRDNSAIDYVEIPELGRACHPGVTLSVHEEFGEVSAYSGFWIMRKTSETTFEKVPLLNQKSFIPQHFPNDARQKVQERLKALGLT